MALNEGMLSPDDLEALILFEKDLRERARRGLKLFSGCVAKFAEKLPSNQEF